MDIIKKRISLEQFKTRLNAPLKTVNNHSVNGSWGEMPVPITIEGKPLKYGTMMDLYHKVIEVLNNTVFYEYDGPGKKWIKVEIEWYNTAFNFVVRLPEAPEDKSIFGVAPQSGLTFIDEYFVDIFGFNGVEYIKKVDTILKDGNDNDVIVEEETNYSTLKLEMPILLTTSINDLGLYKVYEFETDTENENSGKTSYILTGISGESKLQTLRKRKRSYDDNGNELPGIYNGTNELVSPYQIGYIKNIQLLNDKAYGDTIVSMTISEDKQEITIIYVIGGRLKFVINKFELDETSPYILSEDEIAEGDWDSEGMWYKETYPYIEDTIDFIINGEEKSCSYCIIDFFSVMTTYSYKGIDFPRKNYILSTDIRYKSNSYLNNSESFFIYRDDKMGGISENLKEKYDVAIDRGSAAAYEKHLVLTEVKTFQDLELLRNNMFNI